MRSALLVSSLLAACYAFQEWEEYFDHATFLRPNEDYRLYWKLVENELIEIGLEVASTGWIGFGLSDDRSMAGADIITAWIDESGSPYLQRRHSVSKNQRYPVFDEDLSPDLIAWGQENGTTRFHFSRELFPCADENNAFVKQIIQGTTFTIFAFNDNLPICDGEEDAECSLEMHDMLSMGSQSINFFSGETAVIEMPETWDSFDFVMSEYSVPAEDTTYHCRFIELPQEITEPTHLIRFDPVIEQGNEGVVHHLILYWCTDFDEEYAGFESDCNDYANMPDFAGKHCRSEVELAAWAVGGADFYYPAHIGLPLQGKVYALLEIHYDNRQEIEGIVDNSGVRIYWTEELRENDAAKMRVLAPYSETFIPGDLPVPVLNSFYSAPDCTRNSDIPAEGVKVFAGLLHAHTIAVGMKLRHIRDNVELATVMRNDNYDFNFQTVISLDEFEVLPGDEFVCECVYDSEAPIDEGRPARVYPTYGGERTRDEMCVCSMYFWPASNIRYSATAFGEDRWTAFFATAIEEGWWNGTTSWYNNSLREDDYYYDTHAEGALQHYVDFQASAQRVSFCDIGDREPEPRNYTVPEARDGFVALAEDEFGDCSASVNEDSEGLTDEQFYFIVGGGALLLLALVVMAVVCCKRRSRRKVMKPYTNMVGVEETQYGATAH